MSERAQPPESESGLGEQLVLNALRDLVEEKSIVLADDASRDLIREAYEMAVSPEEQRSFKSALDAVVTDSAEIDGVPDHDTTPAEVVGAVTKELADRGAMATIDHVMRVSLAAREVALYNVMRCGQMSGLETLESIDGISEHVADGVDYLMAESHERAIRVFEEAIGSAESTDAKVVARVLSGWAHHQAGNDPEALEVIEEVSDLDESAWSARMVELSAGADSPELFRNGLHGTGVYLRARATIPDESEIDAAIGRLDDETAALPSEWTALPGAVGFFGVDELGATTWLRLRMHGPITSLPVVHAYYLALGVIDERNEVPRSVDEIFLTGPETATTMERVRLESTRRRGE